MVDIPNELVQAIQAGDCVLWAGAGFGALAGRPGWNELLSALVADCDKAVRDQLTDLLEQGRLRTVLSYIHRHKGDGPLGALLQKVSAESEAAPLAAGAAGLAALPWRATFATTYADVVWQIFRQAGQTVDVLSHVDVHDLSLRKQKSPFVLRTPPTGRSMRADRVFYELVEEVVRTRTIVFLGFDIDDPDLYQILALLDRVGRGRRHYAWLAYVTQAEAEELLENYGIEVIHAEDVDLPAAFAALGEAVGRTAPRPSTADADIVALDLSRALTNVDIRADLGVDEALGCDVAEVERLIAALPGSASTSLDPRTQLRVGTVFLAHDRLGDARRCFQHIVSRGAGREYEAVARFNLALLAASENDSAGAVEGLTASAEAQRTLALVPPRFEIREVVARDGARVMMSCRDRETAEELDITVATIGRVASEGEQRRFYEEVQRLVEVDHVAIKKHRGAFADGRLFGMLGERTPGFVLADVLSGADGPAGLDKAFESLGPLMDGLEACHQRGVLHRNITPHQIVMTPRGAVLRGFGVPPTTSFWRPSVVRATRGYVAPEVLAGAEPSAASDVFSLAAVLHRCVAGLAPSAGGASASSLNPQLDPRIDEILARALHPEARRRPGLKELRTAIATILTTPRPAAAAAVTLGEPAAPAAAPESVTPPLGTTIQPPADPDDLEAWTWILERKPTHMEARQAIDRIERESRDGGRWDRVAEVLNVRAQLAQAQNERIEVMRELASVLENQLGAPGSAFETLHAIFDELSLGGRVGLIDDLLRLGEVTGRWAAVAECVATVANAVVDDAERARLGIALGRIYAQELGAPDRAIACYEAVAALRSDDTEVLHALLDLHRRTGHKAEVASTLLGLAELEQGSARVDDLLEAAEILSGELGEQEGALETVEAVLAEDPENDRALALAEEMARALERWGTVATVLARRADAAFDDVAAAQLRREAARLYLERLQDEDAALAQYRKIVDRDRGDVEATRRLVELLRRRVAADESMREPLIDALYALAEQAPHGTERAKLWSECAELLDREPDGAERAADCREQVVAALPAADPVARAAVEGLVGWYRRQESHHRLAELHGTLAADESLDPAARIDHWVRLLELRRGPLDDGPGAREALEALMRLQPGEPRWRDQLLERYLDEGDDQRAGELIGEQIRTAQAGEQKVALLVNLGKLRLGGGDLPGAEEALTQAVALDPNQPRAWATLQELYEQTQQPMKAIEAQIRAGETSDIPVEKVRRLYDAARMCIEVLGLADRGMGLLERVVELDPDHRGATGTLLDALVEAGDLLRAWPIAQAFALQVRAQAPDDHALNLHALTTAGRCALAADERDKAREYLGRARQLDATNLEVVRALADLDMDAGAWSDALRGYQSVVLAASGTLSTREQADLYLRMGRARAGLGETAKAIQMIERALDIDPDHESAARALVELAAGGRPADRVRAQVRLAELLEHLAESREGEEAVALRRELVGLLREVANILADQLNRPDEAVRHLERLLELQPGDPAILHQMLDLYTAQERWRDATGVLSRLAELQPMAAAGAKYLYAGALLLRDHVDDLEETRQWLRRVLDADPLHDRAFRASVEMLQDAREWKGLSKVLRERLKALPEDADPEERVLLFDQIGVLYDEKLGDPKTALAAFEQAISHAPAGSDADRMLERRKRVIRLAASTEDAAAKAIEQTQAIIAERPMEFEHYHQLVLLHAQAGDKDAAMCVARALRFLKQATPKEQQLAGLADGALAQARGTLARDFWRQNVYHPLENPRLSDLFSLIWHIVAAREGQTHAHVGVKRDDRVAVSLQASGLARFVAYACQVCDTPVPDLFERSGESGGFAVAALASDNMVYPSLLAGDDALGKQPDPAYAFRAGRAVARVQPEHILASVLRSGANLRDAVYGAVAVAQPNVAVPAEARDRVGAYADLIRRHLPPARLDTLRALTARVIESGGADTKAWLIGVDYTVSRIGFLLSDNLETAARIVTQGATEGALVPAKDLVKDLVAFSVGPGYLRARKALKMGR